MCSQRVVEPLARLAAAGEEGPQARRPAVPGAVGGREALGVEAVLVQAEPAGLDAAVDERLPGVLRGDGDEVDGRVLALLERERVRVGRVRVPAGLGEPELLRLAGDALVREGRVGVRGLAHADGARLRGGGGRLERGAGPAVDDVHLAAQAPERVPDLAVVTTVGAAPPDRPVRHPLAGEGERRHHLLGALDRARERGRVDAHLVAEADEAPHLVPGGRPDPGRAERVREAVEHPEAGSLRRRHTAARLRTSPA
jgi:hypothetical protein